VPPRSFDLPGLSDPGQEAERGKLPLFRPADIRVVILLESRQEEFRL